MRHLPLRCRSLPGLVALVGSLALAGLACNLGSATGGDEPTPTQEASPTPEVLAPTEGAAAAFTPVSLPTVAADPAQPIVRVIDQLNVRTGPSAYCPVVAVLPRDSQVPVNAISPERGWWSITYGAGAVGWISAAYTVPVTDVSAVPVLAGPACQPPTQAAATTAASVATTPAPVVVTATGGATQTPIVVTATSGSTIVPLPSFIAPIDPGILLTALAPTPTPIVIIPIFPTFVLPWP